MTAEQTLSTTRPDGTPDVARFADYDGKTWATVNDSQMFRVNKVQILNPSARGGAYKTVWLARTRQTLRVQADTRKAATEGMVTLLRSRGFTF
jgi:hypothetical protein